MLIISFWEQNNHSAKKQNNPLTVNPVRFWKFTFITVHRNWTKPRVANSRKFRHMICPREQPGTQNSGQVTVDMSLSLATLTKTSSSVVSAMPQAKMFSLLFASSMARNTSEIFRPSLGISNFCVPETQYTLFAAGKMERTRLWTSSSPAGVVTVSTHEPPYLSFSWR